MSLKPPAQLQPLGRTHKANEMAEASLLRLNGMPSTAYFTEHGALRNVSLATVRLGDERRLPIATTLTVVDQSRWKLTRR